MLPVPALFDQRRHRQSGGHCRCPAEVAHVPRNPASASSSMQNPSSWIVENLRRTRQHLHWAQPKWLGHELRLVCSGCCLEAAATPTMPKLVSQPVHHLNNDESESSVVTKAAPIHLWRSLPCTRMCCQRKHGCASKCSLCRKWTGKGHMARQHHPASAYKPTCLFMPARECALSLQHQSNRKCFAVTKKEKFHSVVHIASHKQISQSEHGCTKRRKPRSQSPCLS